MSQLLKRFFYALPLVFIGCLGSTPGYAAETRVVAISAGSDHTCAITTAGGVKCWGSNKDGQLGNNSTVDSSIPVDVTGLSSGVVAISSVAHFTCALTTVGGVKCWGADNLIPIDIPGLTSGVTAITSYGTDTCVLTTIGGVKCFFIPFLAWFSYTLEDHLGLSSGVTVIAASFSTHTCVLTTAGGVKCWGNNYSGQLGNNSTTASSVPVDVTGLSSGVAAIVTGFNSTFALTKAGGVKSWGNSDIFLAYIPSYIFPSSLTPVDVAGLTSGIVAIDTDGLNFCALTMAGGVKCLGFNDYGQLGNNSDSDSSIPTDVTGLTGGVSAISVGWKYTCALTTAGGVKCWGRNEYGQLGDNSKTDRSTPVDVVGLGDGVSPDPILPPGPVAPASPLTGLWWNQNESGWGMSITQRDAMAFLAWYTYDSIGQPSWFVISSCPLVGSGCTGDIYSVVGGTPLGVPWNGNGKVVTKVGTGTFAYSDNNTGTLNYTVNGVNGTKQITRQMFATGAIQPTVDYSALWWNENESGWGLAITQQFGMIFATMYTYDASGNPVWYVASSCPLSGNSCAGDLYQVTGGSAPTVAWNDAAKVVTKVGTVNFTFQNSSAGTLTYTINGVSGVKVISRQLF
ncbi:RCC1 domain-containing protein [Candidatus Nitrotoga sp. BS]|uniref:RCC1 domain-containing protein n=1 Tax=Candidatus Nitrotoga sp. BS TaxID=2890408 RepID=UPI001EF2B312|nr:hypothetical protein [Candidatus Nitrotoga sp. BS]